MASGNGRRRPGAMAHAAVARPSSRRPTGPVLEGLVVACVVAACATPQANTPVPVMRTPGGSTEAAPAKPNAGVPPAAPPAAAPAPAPAPAAGVATVRLPVGRPTLKVGDRWVYHGVDSSRNEPPTVISRSIASVAGDKIELRQVYLDPKTSRPNGPERMRKGTISTGHLDFPSLLTGEVKSLVFPLDAGKSWEYEYKVKSESDNVTVYKFKATVEGLETVRVPAGTFETVRVVHAGEWSRFVLDQGKVTLAKGAISSTYWYAPAVANWVQQEVDLRKADGSADVRLTQALVTFDRKR